MAADQGRVGSDTRSDGFGEDKRRLFLAALRKGESVLEACRLVGISNRTAYNHRNRDPEFARYWELARSMSWLPVELATFERAVTGIEEPVFVYGKLSHTRRRFSDSLLRKLLEGEKPRKYGRAAGLRSQRKWLKKQIAAQVAAAIAPLAERLQTVNVVNPRAAPDSSCISRARRGKSRERPARRVPPGAGNFAENRSTRELGGGAAQPIVDRAAEAGIGDRRNGDAGLGRRFGLVEPFEQIGGRLDQVARSAERGVAGDRAEADQPFVAARLDGVEAERLGRRVMAGELSGGFDAGRVLDPEAEVDRPRAEQAGPAVRQRDDGRFQAMGSGAAVDDQRYAPAEAGEDVGGAGRADPAADIGGRSGERPAGGFNEGAHRRMSGRADCHGGQARGDECGDSRAAAQRQNQRQRARPVAIGERGRLVVETGDLGRLTDIAHMDDQRIEARPPLGLVDPRDGLAVGRVGGEAVDGLGRHRHRLPGGDQPRRLGDRLGSISQDAGVLRAHRAAL
ncbi:MAG: hypothetical protein QOH47_213 [Sphingomonadales bacterium]|nr:hypothetical protein [Sphingomonadales bacterium]